MLSLALYVMGDGRICARWWSGFKFRCIGEWRNLAAVAERASGNISLRVVAPNGVS